jgi:hypothetical protein
MTVEIWSNIRGLIGRRLHTLDRRKPFVVSSVDETELILMVESTGKQRKVHRSEIEGAFNDLWLLKEISRAEIRERHSEANPAYVASILAEFPEVDVKLKPIRLYWRK